MAASISFDNDGDIRYRFIDWEQWGKMAYQLAEIILSKNLKFDRVIALATGGLTLSRAMKDYLGIAKISSLHISFYKGVGSRSKTPVITQSVPANLQEENILIFDDINDSGETIKTAKTYVSMHGASSITTATILQKPTTSAPSDYFVSETSDWIIFPDEIRETITFLSSKWKENGLTKNEIETRLKQIGFSDQHIGIVLPN